MSKALVAYVFAGLLGLGAYVALEFSGWVPSSAAYERIDPSVRRSPGGGGTPVAAGDPGRAGKPWSTRPTTRATAGASTPCLPKRSRTSTPKRRRRCGIS